MLALVVTAASAHANNLVQNGDFEQLLRPGVAAGFGSLHPSQQVTDWSTSGYNFVFTAGSADTTGAVGQYGGLTLWGPNNGSANGLPATSPTGGNFLGMDGAYEVGAVSQTVNGLTPGHAATVSFYWAAAQQEGFSGATTDQFKVSLGSQSQLTPILSLPSHGFAPWRKESFTFTPTGTSEVLSFLAIGTPAGVPPFALLDGVSLSDSPEPSTLGLLGFAAAGVGAFGAFRRKTLPAEPRAE